MIEGRNARDQLDPMHLIHFYQSQSKEMLAAYESRIRNSDLTIGIFRLIWSPAT